MGKIINYLKSWFQQDNKTRYPYPAIDVTLSDKLKLHLVGSIHMGTENMFPLSSVLLDKIATADALIVEADINSSVSPFSNEHSQVYPELEQRLNEQEYQQLLACCQEIQQSASQFDQLPSWQVALILQATQAQRLGLRPHYGIDYQLLNAARNQQKNIIELEGAEAQMALLLQLPDEGLSLLQDTLIHWRTNARSLQMMISWWLDFSTENTIKLPMTFSEGVYEILMNRRNKQWSEKLKSLPDGHYVVAVGALHLYGEGSLVEYLQTSA